jgi:hypothetical protein
MEKFVKVRFASEKKEVRASEVRKTVESDSVGVSIWWTTQATSTET